MLKAGVPTEAAEAGPGGTRILKKPASAPLSPAEIAEHFPHLKILECLGRGGMGVVYRARQPHLNRLVALKILAPEKETDPAFAERFTREAQALARLNHPNIVTVYDFGRVNHGLFFLLMEFVDGMSLRELLQAGRIKPEEALAIVPKICEALQFAHEHGVVHRDIKPENVLLDKDGRVKIADFGIAKLIQGEQPQPAITQEQQVIGTPHYMAPEQIEQPQAVDHRADIYSLGVVFYEMLTGELPLGKFAPPSRKVQVDVRLDEVVLHALEKDRERRYQHASELKTDVETIADSPAAPALPERTLSPPPRAPANASRKSSARLAWGLTAITLIVAIGIIVAQRIDHGDMPSADEDSRALSENSTHEGNQSGPSLARFGSAETALNVNSAAGAPPVVVRTVPESGAADVDPALNELHVTFSKPMQDGNWSWLIWSEEHFPELTGAPKYLSDQRTCILPVRLAPGKVYALWLNSEKFQNFKDHSGIPAVPYLLIFQTRK